MAHSGNTGSQPNDHEHVNANVVMTEEQIQARIDAAVEKAMEKVFEKFKESGATRSKTVSKPVSKPPSTDKKESSVHSSNVKDEGKKKELLVEEHTSKGGCSYKYFISCKPRDFNGEKGAVETLRWLDEMENCCGY